MATVVAPDGVARGSLDRLNIVIIGMPLTPRHSAHFKNKGEEACSSRQNEADVNKELRVGKQAKC